MFCTNCGHPLKEGQNFCTNCGTSQKPAPSPESQPAPEPKVEPAPAPAPKVEPAPAPAPKAEPAPKTKAKAVPKAKPAPAPAPKAADKPAKAKKSKGGLIAALVVTGVLILLAVVAVVLWLVLGQHGQQPGVLSSEPPALSDEVDTPSEEEGPAEAGPVEEDYDFSQLTGVYYCSQEPGSTLELATAGSRLSIFKTAGSDVDIQTIIDPPSGPSFSIDYGGRVIEFFYSPSVQTVTVTQDGSTSVFTPDGNLLWPANAPAEDTPETVDPFTDPDAYILPTDIRYITVDELYDFTPEQVKLIRNEIYARHGYSFTMDKFREYFRNKNWYLENLSVNANTFGTAQMNEYERANVELISNYEDAMGW